MPLSRRLFLAAGASALILTVAGRRTFVRAETLPDARAPWAAAPASAHPDARVRALGYAILAPNPHNRQPWLAELVGSDAIVVRCDLDRRLPETDPYDRQITIGFGCFLELLRMAAAAQGHEVEIGPFPEGEPSPRLDERPIARVRFLPRADAVAPEPLFAQVLARRSNKEPYDIERPVADDALEALRSAVVASDAVRTSNAPALVDDLRDLTWRAARVEAETPRTHMESIDLIRIGRSEIDASPDGIALGGPMVEELHAQCVLTRETLADSESEAYRQTLDRYRAVTDSAMAYIWLTTPGNERRTQLEAGRDWLRVNLKATELGLGLHPLSQALQEFPEMAPLHEEAHRRLGAPAGGRVQMLGRVGYGPAVGPAPRWPVETRIAGP